MRTYDINFREEAVRLSESLGTSKAARELGIPEATLYTWVSKSRKGTLKGSNGPPKAMNLAEENRRLKQEVKELREVNEILSKATAFFAKGQKK